MLPNGASKAAQRLPRTIAATASTPLSTARMNYALAGAAVAAAAAYGLYLRRNNVAHADDGRDAQPKAFGGFPPFKRLTLESAEMVSHNTKRLRFAFPDPEAVSGLGPSSATLTVSFPGGGWKPTPRPYTPVSDSSEKGHLDLLVKHYPGGAASTHMHSLKPGDSLLFMPIPGYGWTPNKHAHVALIAGGAGITPMYSLARAILGDPSDRTRVTLVWAVNEDRDLFLADEFADLERRHPGRFRAVYAVARPEAGSPHAKGYVTRELLRSAGIEPAAGQAGPGRDTKVLVCGPPPMEAALAGKKGWGGGGDGGVLGKMGFSSKQIYRF